MFRLSTDYARLPLHGDRQKDEDREAELAAAIETIRPRGLEAWPETHKAAPRDCAHSPDPEALDGKPRNHAGTTIPF